MKFTDITLADVSIETKVETLGIALDKQLSELTSKVAEVDTIVGPKGDKGDPGSNGRDGVNGINGKDGKDGIDGKDGKDGQDGVSVVDAKIAADDSIVFVLSDGKEIDIGTPSLFTGGAKVNYNTTTVRTAEAPVYTVRYDEIDETLAYRGEAVAGNAESAKVWRIQKIVIIDNDVTITWAGGNTGFANAWTDHLSLTYL